MWVLLEAVVNGFLFQPFALPAVLCTWDCWYLVVPAVDWHVEMALGCKSDDY